MKLPATRNPDHGFYGTIRQHGGDPETAWPVALGAVASWWPAARPRDAYRWAREFLDSAGGRHFADVVADIPMTREALRAALPPFHGYLR